jgi:hypothetical protein
MHVIGETALQKRLSAKIFQTCGDGKENKFAHYLLIQKYIWFCQHIHNLFAAKLQMIAFPWAIVSFFLVLKQIISLLILF